MTIVPRVLLRFAGAWVAFCFFFAPEARAEGLRLVAVLPLADPGNTVEALARETIEETIRTVGGDLLNPRGFVILTGENTLRLLSDNGVDAAKACEASCALAAARELKAHLFIGGSASKLEGQLILFVRLYDADTGAQLSSLKLETDTVKGVRAAFEAQAPSFFEKGLRALDARAAAPVAPVALAPDRVAAAPGSWRLKVLSPNAKEPWSLLDAQLTPLCASLPCELSVPPEIAYKFRRGATQPSGFLDIDLKVNLKQAGFTPGAGLRAVAGKDWAEAARLGYGIVGGSLFGAGVVSGLATAIAAGWSPTDWFDSKGLWFWGIAGIGTLVAAVTGTVVFLAVNPQRALVEFDVP